jgi:hypothetical protein
LHINYFLKHFIEETIERRREKTWKKKLGATGWPKGKDKMLKFGRGSTKLQSLQKSFWKE